MSLLRALRPYSRIKIPISSSRQFFEKLKSREFATNVKQDIEEDKPLEYLSSKAATWKAESSRTQGKEQMLWYQPLVVCGSVASLLIYFCILREENDIDEELGASLYSRVPGLEKQNLLLIYEQNKNNGLDVTDIENRLKEILREERAATR